MRPRGAWTAAALLASLWATPLLAKDEPDVHVSSFKHSPDFLSYFEDSDVILFQDIRAGVIYRSEDAGSKWAKVTAVPEGDALRLVMHEYDSKRAYVLTEGIIHYKTHDRGKTWQTFVTDARVSVFEYEILMFHADDPDRIIFNGMDCESIFCDEVAKYTTDGFKSPAQYLRGNTAGCWWAKSSHLFTTGAEDLDAQRILCVVRDAISPFKQDQRLFISDNYFNAKTAGGPIQEFEPDLDMSRPVRGIVNIAVVKKYLLVATTSVNTDEMALFVTDDTLKWHRAMFPTDHKVNQQAYTVLESTNYSIQIDVMTTRPSNPVGVMFTSNSNGTFFTKNVENTNRNSRGHVDFEKIAGIQGIFLVNKVVNADEVMKKGSRAKKEIITEITFDDGRTFSDVKAGKDRIHLHSVTDLSNVGRVFSSPAPGLVMGVGNTGALLGSYYKDGHLYVSDDAGETWSRALDGPHKYEFGDQGSVLVAVEDVEDEEDAKVGKFSYSLDHGKTWTPQSFPDDLKIVPWILTTTQDSTSLKFVLVGKSKDGLYQIIAIDFDGLHEATCKDSDMEEWWARADESGKGTCLMGHTQMYRRRKKDAACFLKKEFVEPHPEPTDCECTDRDFECDYNFKRVGDECEPAGPIQDHDDACKGKSDKDTFKGSSGWRLIPGNTCKRTSGKQKDALQEHSCKDSSTPPPPEKTGKVAKKPFTFEGEGDWNAFEVIYLERGETSSTMNDESIIARPINNKDWTGGKVYITHDHGKTWNHPAIFDKNSAYEIVPHQYFKEMVFFLTSGKKVIYTIDHGKTFHEFKAPDEAEKSGGSPLAFHPDKKDWLIWMGKHCEEGGECFTTASYSKDRGDTWNTLRRYAPKCEFIGNSGYKYRNQTEILCLARQEESNAAKIPYVLVTSDDWFENSQVRETNVKDFATMSEFVVVATEDAEKQSLRAAASLDGKTYAEAKFPTNFQVPHQRAYTVLDSSTHAVNLFVATSTKDRRRFGAILKSNSNGTNYALSLAEVNADESFEVDFEKMLGLEGVAVANVVANADDESATTNKLQSRISHNDGAEWSYLPPPRADVNDKAYDCGSDKGEDACALHIHGYTARKDKRKTFSSEGAIGLMFGVGNVGPHLGEIKEADTFLTADAGITWTNVKKGEHVWQFGDQGSIIILGKPAWQGKTKIVSYTTDEGATWVDYEFHDEEVEVVDITTLRSGASRNFLIWCRDGSKMFTVNLDFSGLTDRACKDYDKNDRDNDYHLWTPEHPLMRGEQCLFGHKAQYLRKKADKTCYNGYKMKHLYNEQNCSCSRIDYEW